MATKREIGSSPTTGSPTPHPVRCHRFIRSDEYSAPRGSNGFALDEVVVHGWDLVTATAHDFAAAPEELEAVIGFFASFPDEAREPGFGLAHPVPEDAPLLDRAVALSGRDPDWAPTP